MAFVTGLRSAADPPLPGQSRTPASPSAGLWTPAGRSEPQVA